MTFSLAPFGYGHCAGLTSSVVDMSNGFVNLGTWVAFSPFGEENGIKPVNDSVPVQMPYSRSDPQMNTFTLPFQLVSFSFKIEV